MKRAEMLSKKLSAFSSEKTYSVRFFRVNDSKFDLRIGLILFLVIAEIVHVDVFVLYIRVVHEVCNI